MASPTVVPNFEFERAIHRQGYSHVAGIDEVGRGCLAGPVAAGAVILPDSPSRDIFDLVRDSKQLRGQALLSAYEAVTQEAVAYAVGWTDPAEIDRLGIGPAVRVAMRRALGKLSLMPDYLLIDAVTLDRTNTPQTSIVKGDSRSLSIAASAIVAKVERDRLMAELDDTFPEYGFASHKGYATRRHIDALTRSGPCPVHRMSFQPVSGAPFRRPPPTAARVGQWAESFASRAMEERGARLVDLNFRTRYGEVDLIASQGSTLVFVEVRARRSQALASPAETVSASKARRVIAACQEYLQTTDIDWTDWRIDLAAVELDQWQRPASVTFIESAVEDLS